MFEMLKPSDKITVLTRIDPDALAPATASSAYVYAGGYNQILAIVQVGDITATGTVDAKLRQATDAAGTGVKDITGALITQFTAAGTDSDKMALINLDPNKLDVAGGFDFVKLDITTATAAAEIAGLVLGVHARYGPGAHVAAVDEVVTV